ncbi:DEAD-box ATP-dependent RNA helicase 32 [Andrographis paniculata]|uniref:DEAD-box ATP-dependent RNA helicase 32 n=1 Tax=Andrographis paniculata TaxID=175694 RepID=UPI0021E8DF11|nr:DEAD-box ATP-dependent RNA helicase 32 [Andrographis paniculata]XP_051125088.1 DEAD-box ATP-dependent RNA helicase 32 [Andrographis paniculata]
MKRPKSRKFNLRKRHSEVEEIELLESWIASGKPDAGSNPLSLPPPPKNSRIGKLSDGSFSPYSSAVKFIQLPLSKKTKDGLAAAGYSKMTDIQRASLPHSLCGRDILGAAKTGSGKTLAFIVPVLEKLFRARWGSEDGVGCIIISPTRELGGQLFDVLKSVGRYHGFSAGLLIGGRKDVDTEKERVNNLNILVCTPGRLLHHMDETPNFDCPQLQVLVLDEADRILDEGFKKQVNAIISQLPKYRQTFLFSATQTKSVQDLARLSLKDPEYISVDEESETATPSRLKQTAIVVPLDQKLDMLWSFIKTHLKSRILVFLSSCKQVKFVFEAFKKLRPGIPLKCLHGRMKQDKRTGIYSQFCEQHSVLFCTDVAARGLDFNQAVDWVVQADCPDDVASYIHRVGRTARYCSGGNSVLFVTPSETKMIDKLKEKKIPIECVKVKAKLLQPVSGLMAALLAKYPNLQQLAQRAFITYLRSVHKQRDKEVFDVSQLPIDEYSASLGLPMTPKVRFLKQKTKDKKVSEQMVIVPISAVESPSNPQQGSMVPGSSKEDDSKLEEGFLAEREPLLVGEENVTNTKDSMPVTRVLKKKKLKINVHRPVGTRVVFDEEGNTLPPLAKLADTKMDADSVKLDKDKVSQRYAELREAMKVADKEDKALAKERLKEKRRKEKMKRKRSRDEDKEESGLSEEDQSDMDNEANTGNSNKKQKVYFDSDNEDDGRDKIKMKDKITLREQEELALKLLSSMHS